MNDERERQVAVTTLSFIGIAALVYLGGVGATVSQEAAANQDHDNQQSNTIKHPGEWPPTPTPTSLDVQGQLVHPQPEGVTLPDNVGKNGEPLLEVVSKSGEVYKVQKIHTGQYKIIEPEPQLFDIKFLRPEDVAYIK